RIVEAFGCDETDGYAAVVMGVPDAAKGEQLVILSARDEITPEAVREKLTALGLPNLWIPKVVKRVAKIPVLGTGKLDLKAAKELAL
ncbi:MAG: Bifunctional protein Aas, partial [Verrucomicrobiota bacterium]